ncbi:hypothetical protein IQ251_12305 [Saccharopolyspora sp. HNM0983]|uniref:Uncharacterized protein n=1 Tax=Saccharopolyspora montiporae TaxID=2781240 RepID=A0A929BAG5_9PSEU|nr:hypothetical protein [Saccharopolyspora sp. HNM0983]MBE9375226.1 hypothetical protein [Saccharopolyspora sp. HNM0983]
MLVPLLCAVPAGGISGFALFGVLLVCFAAGTAAGEFLLGRVWRFPVSQSPEPSPGAADERAPERPRELPPAGMPRTARTSGEAAAFAFSGDAGSLLEITLLAARGPRVPDPAEGVVPGSAALAPDERPLRPGPVGGDGPNATDPVEPGRDVPDGSGGRPEAAAEDATAHAVVPQPAPPVAQSDAEHPFPGAVRAKADGRSPDKGYRVKGNARSKLYHTMQSPYYERTKATVWFRSAAEAEQAGFSPWNWRTQNDN